MDKLNKYDSQEKGQEKGKDIKRFRKPLGFTWGKDAPPATNKEFTDALESSKKINEEIKDTPGKEFFEQIRTLKHNYNAITNWTENEGKKLIEELELSSRDKKKLPRLAKKAYDHYHDYKASMRTKLLGTDNAFSHAKEFKETFQQYLEHIEKCNIRPQSGGSQVEEMDKGEVTSNFKEHNDKKSMKEKLKEITFRYMYKKAIKKLLNDIDEELGNANEDRRKVGETIENGRRNVEEIKYSVSYIDEAKVGVIKNNIKILEGNIEKMQNYIDSHQEFVKKLDKRITFLTSSKLSPEWLKKLERQKRLLLGEIKSGGIGGLEKTIKEAKKAIGEWKSSASNRDWHAERE